MTKFCIPIPAEQRREIERMYNAVMVEWEALQGRDDVPWRRYNDAQWAVQAYVDAMGDILEVLGWMLRDLGAAAAASARWELRPAPGALTWSGSDWEVDG